MRDIYETKISIITFVIIFRSCGSIAGASLAGLILDKWPKLRHFALFSATFLMGATNMLLPHAGYLWLFFVFSTLASFACGFLDTGGNVLVLDTWKNDDVGPYMHSIHFSFAIGAFLAPILAMPFLSKNEDFEAAVIVNGTLNELAADPEPTRITYLFPMLGLAVIVCSFGYFIFGLQLRNYQAKNAESSEAKKSEKKTEKFTIAHWTFLSLMCMFFFFYVGAEVSYGVYLTTFAVQSRLKLSKQIGAQVTANFWGCFAAMRFISIFTSIYFKPLYIMIFSCMTSCIGAFGLIIWGDVSYLMLQLGSSLLGFGMAAIFATGILWMGTFVTVTNRIQACASVASSIGADVFPIILGQLIADHPMTLMYITFATLVLCFGMFMSAFMVGKHIRKRAELVQNTELRGEHDQFLT